MRRRGPIVGLLAAAALGGGLVAGAGAVSGKPDHRTVRYVNPDAVPAPINGSWSQLAVTRDAVYVAGQRGRRLDGTLVPLDDDGSKRIRQAYRNMKAAAASQGASLHDALRIVVYASDIRYRAVANAIQNEREFWGDAPKPPRTFVVVSELAEKDIFEVEGTFARPKRGR